MGQTKEINKEKGSICRLKKKNKQTVTLSTRPKETFRSPHIFLIFNNINRRSKNPI